MSTENIFSHINGNYYYLMLPQSSEKTERFNKGKIFYCWLNIFLCIFVLRIFVCNQKAEKCEIL